MNITAFGDLRSLTGRTLKHVFRSPDTIITSAVMPVAIMALLVYVFGGSLQIGKSETAGVSGISNQVAYLDYLLPGILLMTTAMGVSYTALRLFEDMSNGIIDRFRSMPISRSSILWSHVLSSVLAISISLVLVVAVALVMGFRSGAGWAQWLIVVGILLAFTLAMTWLAVIPALVAKTSEGASAFAYPLIFLPFFSSAFVVTATLPRPLRWFAEHQPITSIVDALRNQMHQVPAGPELWIALAWCAVALILSWVLALVLFRRRTTQQKK